ncbi:hypothetical protein MSG28_010941 [Choristoneura fumiferana]|uniref:Uncharacterized protein n=1 Tax=Choristoneura fumiferana TaxID=7141 RepID=A0ACC0KQU2_CHOFU|nr:hypothetical protein MSG28_010941 [Choristoneura fumiferana]
MLPPVVTLKGIKMYWLPLLVGLLASGAYGQLTAQSSVAPALRECYTDTLLQNRNNLPPATINVLIDIIRHVEDAPNVNMGLREIAVSLLHTYRQDGIEYHQPEANLVNNANILPYAPTFHSFHRHRLLLTKLIPNNLQVLENTTLSSPLKCAIHNMLSTTVDARVQGNGNCNQFSQYRALRTARQVSDSDIADDVEILDPALLNSKNRMGQMRQYNPKNDVEYNNYGSARSERQLLGESLCPILTGVVRTFWGEVSAGHLIAGIAAGSESQRVSVLELAKGSVLNYANAQQTVSSVFAATLSGDLAEAVLIQGTERGNPTISIGATGYWNSTQALKYFMLRNRVNIEMTDPEIRGDIDGYVLGSNLNTPLATYGSLKLSQLLDMYYSRNGVFNLETRACNRRSLMQQYITNANLVTETYTFAAALDTQMPLRGTITGGLDSLVDSAVTNFQSYASSIMNDLNCGSTESLSIDYLFTGVNLQTSLTNIRTLMHERLEIDRMHNYVGGNATVLLFLLNSGNLQNNDQIWQQARILNETVPDLRILFTTSTNQMDNLWNLVRDMHQDIHTISLTTTVNHVEALAPTLNRIQQTGRRIINPLCGATYNREINSGSRTFEDFVEPNYINFYAISPNYFYSNNENRRIRISRTGAAMGNSACRFPYSVRYNVQIEDFGCFSSSASIGASIIVIVAALFINRNQKRTRHASTTFRQDGIVYDPTAIVQQSIVPYSPTGFPIYKNMLLLTKLLPVNQFHLPTDSLTPEEKEWTCNSISLPNNQSARLASYREADDVEVIDVNRCPVETGVVSTPWGDVSMGPVIAGISAGLEQQNVLVSDLVTLNSYANRHYFHVRTTDLELTDAEIRGGLDGIILSELGLSNAKVFPELKLSQLIDMYYTTSIGPAVALYHASPLSGTTNLRGIEQFVNNTVAAFHSYIPLNIRDPVCIVSVSQVLRPIVNLILITSEANRNLISYIIDNIEVGKYGSSITLLHPETGEVIVDKTFSPAKFYTEFALRYSARFGTLNIVNGLQSLRTLVTRQAELDKTEQYAGGNATVALFLSDTIPLTGDDWNRAMQHTMWLRNFAPGPRRIVNPLCGIDWVDRNSGTIGFEDYVDANGINLYRLIPNYFFVNNPSRLRNQTSGTVPGDVICESVTSGNAVEINLAEACSQTATVERCRPFYLTVSSVSVPLTPQCKDSGCRYPNDLSMSGEDCDALDRGDNDSQKSDKMFTLKKWNAVAMWSWDVECDTCAICRVQVMVL